MIVGAAWKNVQCSSKQASIQ